MKRKFRLLLITVAVVVISSCGAFNKVNMIPSTALNTNNYMYVRSVQAKISYTYVFGIGGFGEKYLIDDLTKKAKLLPGEAFDGKAEIRNSLSRRNCLKGWILLLICIFTLHLCSSIFIQVIKSKSLAYCG